MNRTLHAIRQALRVGLALALTFPRAMQTEGEAADELHRETLKVRMESRKYDPPLEYRALQMVTDHSGPTPGRSRETAGIGGV